MAHTRKAATDDGRPPTKEQEMSTVSRSTRSKTAKVAPVVHKTHEGTIATTHLRRAFVSACSAGTQQHATVASTSSANPIRILDRNCRVDVIPQHGSDRQEHTLVNFTRRSPPGASDDGSVPHSYFIDVPPQTRVDNLDGPIPTATKAKAAEMEQRDKNGDLDEGVVDVIWQPIEAAPPDSPPSQPVSQPLNRAKGYHDEQWTDDAGVLIQNPCDYLRGNLWASQRDHYDELIARVLASINHRQPSESGFSFIHGIQRFRPARTSITARQHKGYHILLLTRRNDAGTLEIYVLDPMAWKSKIEERDGFVAKIFHSDQGKDPVSQLRADWVPCAQQTDEARASTYTVLNAWAIAMDLQVNPSFTPDEHGYENFFTRAQWLFDLALRDLLDWKLLVAFFQCTRFIIFKDSVEDRSEQDLPPPDRRFRQSGRTFQRAIEEQKQADDTEPLSRELGSVPYLPVRTGIGKKYTDLFPADHLSDTALNDIRPLVHQGHWSLMDSTEEHRKRLTQPDLGATSSENLVAETVANKSSGSIRNATEPGKDAQQMITNASRRGQELPDNYDPCEFLQKEMNTKKESAGITFSSQDREEASSDTEVTGQLALTSEEVINSIREVATLINELQPEDQQIAVAERIGHVDPSKKMPITDKLLLLPWEHEKHMTLIAAQRAPVGRTSHAAAWHVLDSAPWTLNTEKRRHFRKDLYGALSSRWTLEGRLPNLPATIAWVFGPRQKALWQCSYFTILNACTILLGCEINLHSSPDLSFFQQANHLIRIVLAGHADWRLVYSFLRCREYVKKGELPGKNRRFRSRNEERVQDDVLFQHDEEGSDDPVNSHDFSKYAAVTRSHDRVFKGWDDWNQKDIFTRVPALFKAGKFNEENSFSQLRNAYQKFVTPPQQSHEVWLNEVKPCAYLNAQLKKLLNDTDITERLESLRSQSDVTYTPKRLGTWLLAEEVSLAIASVTLAITSIQNVTGGFSAVLQSDVDVGNAVDSSLNYKMQAAPRFCRPLLTPFVEGSEIEAHTVLVLIQLDAHDMLTVSVVDSKSHYFNEDKRNRIFEKARAIAKETGWWQKKFTSFDEVPQPKVVKWIPCAQQPDDNECGYYTIVNGWAIALGLELNPHAQPDWRIKNSGGHTLFDVVLHISHLARLGLADWRLIYAFLRCYRFVHEGEVPYDRRFTNTVSLLDEREFKDHIVRLAAQESKYWDDPTRNETDINKIKGRNTVRLPDGYDHTDLTAYIWTQQSGGKALQLSEVGQLRMNMSENELDLYHTYFCTRMTARNKSIGKRIGLNKANFFLESLRQQGRPLNQTSRDKLHGVYRDFLFNVRDKRPSAERLKRQPCALAGEGLGVLEKLLANAELDRNFAGAIAKNQFGRSLDNLQVNLAIAAVVEAIDIRQAGAHSGKTHFTGGFAVASSLSITQAQAYSDTGIEVSRPRRTWLLPITIDGLTIVDHIRTQMGEPEVQDPKEKNKLRNQGHHFLAVVQEEAKSAAAKDKATSVFCIYTLDSSPSRFEAQEVQQLFYDRIRNIAENTKWCEQRNGKDRPGGQVKFRKMHTKIPVFPQSKGGWQCGLHTILNAWILALGLMPRSELPKTLTDETYRELWILVRASIAGFLDWKTLVAWLFCHNLVVERNTSKVTIDRQFESTVYQDGGEMGLIERVTNVSKDGATELLGVSENAIPYIYRNNVDFKVVAAAAAGSVVAEEQVEGDEQDETSNSEDSFTEEELELLKTMYPEDFRNLETLSDLEERRQNQIILWNRWVDENAPDESDEKSDRDTEDESDGPALSMNRSFDEPGVPGRTSSKRKVPESLKRSHDHFDFPCKRARLDLSSDLSFLNEVDVDGDGDVKMTGSPWRKVKVDLSFLKAY